jgi:predicted small lipoprotein YifL
VDTGFLGRLALAGLLVAAIGLAGCGRKGALEAPPAATVEAAPADTAAPPAGTIPKPDKPFVLDGLLH